MPEKPATSKNGNGNQDKPTGSDVKNTSTVVKQFVVDFSREDYKPLMEHEINGLTYRYVNSDKARLSVVVQGIENGSASLLDSRGELHAYYHTDYLGTTDYLTSAVNSKVISWTSYNEWGEITHNAVLKCGQRELDLVKEYATHDYDAVLDLYYAKARFYDAYNRTFTAQDPILNPSQYDLREYVTDPMQLVQYLYVKDNAVIRVDLLGEKYSLKEGSIAHIVITAYIEGLYPGTIADTTLYGVKANASGRGRPDIVIPVKNTYHVYEIKSDQYISWWTYQQSAYRQLEKYINALRGGDVRNDKNYPLAKTAEKGTVLNWKNHIILPYIADANKVIETWTTSTPGMIYYKIRERKKTDEVESEEFATASVRARIRYYAMIACDNPPENEINLVNVDTYGDLELNNNVIEWLDGAMVSYPAYTDAQSPYVMVEYPDGTQKYKTLSGIELRVGREYTYEDLLSIYESKTGWISTVPERVTNGEVIPVMPINPVMPAIPVMPYVPIPAFA